MVVTLLLILVVLIPNLTWHFIISHLFQPVREDYDTLKRNENSHLTREIYDNCSLFMMHDLLHFSSGGPEVSNRIQSTETQNIKATHIHVAAFIFCSTSLGHHILACEKQHFVQPYTLDVDE